MTETDALLLVDDYYPIRIDDLAIIKHYLYDLMDILSDRNDFRYLQVEGKLEEVLRFEMAEEIPLALKVNESH